MNVSIAQSLLLDHAEFVPLVESVEPVVQSEVTTSTTTAEWDFECDAQSRPLLLLRLSDPLSGKVMGQFAPMELKAPDQMRGRIHELHGAMLLVGDWCRKRLPDLYDEIQQWLADWQPAPQFTQSTVLVNERRSGPYEAPSLHVQIASQAVRIEPKAIWTVVGSGRIEVHGPLDNFVLELKEGKWYLLDPANHHFEKPLSKAVFLESFKYLLQ